MKITSISVKKLYTYGNYENVSFGYTANIEEGEDPEFVKANLLDKIDNDYQQLRIERDTENEKRFSSEQLDYEISRKEREAREIQARIEKMIEFLKAHGVDTMTYELPF